jgi:hypothetical protein
LQLGKENMLARIFLIALVAICALQACTYKNKQSLGNTCNVAGTTYNNFVGTWLSNRGCTGCHTNGTPPELSNYAAVKGAAMQMNFMGSIKHMPGYSPMPKSANPAQSKSDSCDIAKLDAWIAAGMPQ